MAINNRKNNFRIVIDTDAVPKPKWRSLSSRIHATSSDSGRHRILLNIKMEDESRN